MTARPLIPYPPLFWWNVIFAIGFPPLAFADAASGQPWLAAFMGFCGTINIAAVAVAIWNRRAST